MLSSSIVSSKCATKAVFFVILLFHLKMQFDFFYKNCNNDRNYNDNDKSSSKRTTYSQSMMWLNDNTPFAGIKFS